LDQEDEHELVPEEQEVRISREELIALYQVFLFLSCETNLYYVREAYSGSGNGTRSFEKYQSRSSAAIG
jgi:hypothetical protein